MKKGLKDLRNLTKETIKKRSIDIMLASNAILNDCILVSNNSIYIALHEKNPNLLIESWR